jgi:hypothetical protein
VIGALQLACAICSSVQTVKLSESQIRFHRRNL